jgi:hypothetical protein
MPKKKIKNHKEKNLIRLGVPSSDTKLSVEDLPDGFFYKIDVVWTSSNDTTYSRRFIHACRVPKDMVNLLIHMWNKEKDRKGTLAINIYRNDKYMWDDHPNTMIGSDHVYQGPLTQEVFDTICEAWKEYIKEEEKK